MLMPIFSCLYMHVYVYMHVDLKYSSSKAIRHFFFKQVVSLDLGLAEGTLADEPAGSLRH